MERQISQLVSKRVLAGAWKLTLQEPVIKHKISTASWWRDELELVQEQDRTCLTRPHWDALLFSHVLTAYIVPFDVEIMFNDQCLTKCLYYS